MRTVKTYDGFDLAVYELGPEGAPVVVLVHGFPDDHRVWDGVAPILAARYRVVTYDTRGISGSTGPTAREGYRLEALAADLRRVLDAVSPGKPAHVVGHDWGGIQSWEAVTDPTMASRIASFTAISGPCLDHAAHWLRKGSKAALSQALKSWYVALFQLPWAPERMVRGGFSESLARREHLPPGTQAPDAASLMRGLELYRANMLERLLAPRERRASMPVQLIAPKDDRYVSPGVVRSAEPWVSELFYREVQGQHWIVRTHPERVARWIDDLVRYVEHDGETPLLLRARVEKAKRPRAAHAGRLVVITGGGSGIGRATAVAFASRGARIVIADVDREGAERTVTMCRERGVDADASVVDVSSRASMEAFADDVAERYGAPDIVVNNAGIGVAGKILDTPVETWEKILGVNLWGVLHGSRLFGAQMVARGQGGHIVNIASAAAFVPSMTLPAYATTKVAVRMLSECLRAELASEGIGVSAICPGLIDTPITTRTTYMGVSAEEQERRRQSSAKLYRRRNLGPEVVAEAIVRAVEQDLAVVPVSIEAHALDWLGRFAPSLAGRLAKVDLTPR